MSRGRKEKGWISGEEKVFRERFREIRIDIERDGWG